MYSISHAVADIISSKPYVQELLTENVINITEFARSIRKEVAHACMKPVSAEAVAMAIRRLPKPRSNSKLELLLKEPFDIMVRSHVCEITVRKQGNIRRIQSILNELTTTSEHFFTITQGIFEDTLMVSEVYKKQVIHMFKKEDIIAQFNNLTAITIRIPPESVETPGVYYQILKGLALEGINVIEVVSTYLECTLLVESKDAQRAFAKLQKVFGVR